MLLLVSSVVFVHETMSPMYWSGSTGYQLRLARIEFKLCLLVYKALNGLAPSYITDMLQPVTTLDRHVTLRLTDNNDLFICSFPVVVSISVNVLFGLQLLEQLATQS